MAQIRIAIADDSPAFAAAAAGYLAALPGCLVVGTAPAANQALALVRDTAPDLLLLDLGRAPARGLERVRAVKAQPGAPAVVAMALFASPDAAAAARHAGASALLGKDSFVARLSAILGMLFPAKAA